MCDIQWLAPSVAVLEDPVEFVVVAGRHYFAGGVKSCSRIEDANLMLPPLLLVIYSERFWGRFYHRRHYNRFSDKERSSTG